MTLGKVGNCQVGVSVHLAGEHASCAADWRLFCPESWDDAKLDDPVAAARAARRRERAGIPGQVRHRGVKMSTVMGSSASSPDLVAIHQPAGGISWTIGLPASRSPSPISHSPVVRPSSPRTTSPRANVDTTHRRLRPAHRQATRRFPRDVSTSGRIPSPAGWPRGEI